MKAFPSAVTLLILLSGCIASGPGSEASPVRAELPALTIEAQAHLLGQLRAVSSSPNMRFGTPPKKGESSVTLLPPTGPLEGNNPALPEIFDLYVDHGRCIAISRTSGQTAPLPNLPCEPAEK